MSRSARYSGFFGDGKHDFQLKIAQLEELQEKCDAGPEEILDRVMTGRWRLAEIREPLRLGLIGSGMEPVQAAMMIERYAGPGQLVQHKALVIGIVGAGIAGAPDEDVVPGKQKGAKPAPSPGESSGSAPSTKSAGHSASRPRRSAKAPSGS